MFNNKIVAALLFCIVAVVVIWKYSHSSTSEPIVTLPVEIPLCDVIIESPVVIEEVEEKIECSGIRSISSDSVLPKEVNIVGRLFDLKAPLSSLVESVSYVARVPWLPSRPAYLGDWASHYETSTHFISRSIKGEGIYLNDKVSRGDRFNVFRRDKTIEFHLVVDLSRTRMWLYYFDKDENRKECLKSYPVCVGSLSEEHSSGSLTPTGVFAVGKEVAVYKEGDMGLYKNEFCEMITVFGRRWIPLSREIMDCSGACKGLGLHGMPWKTDSETGLLVEERDSIGGYSSLGCIRFLTEDIQEIFAIITSKPSYVHIVKDFQDAKVPGEERL